MAEKRSISACVQDIKRINAAYRHLEDQDSAEANFLREQKDKFIDEMESLCPHPDVIALRGGDQRRICPHCGFCERNGFGTKIRTLAGRPAVRLQLLEYIEREGQILRRLGINL